MGEIKNKTSFVRLFLELVEQSIVLVFLELKLAAVEVKHNIDSAKTGAVLLGLGGFLLLFSLLGVMATAIAALALVLPVWLSALIVTAVFLFAGGGLLFVGLSKLKHFTVVPRETVDRVETIAHKLKKHAEERERREMEERTKEQEERAAKVAAKEAAREARVAARAERKATYARGMTYAREKEREAEEAREAKRKTA